MEPSGRNRWLTGRKWENPENGSNKPIGNRWQPTATVSERMVKSVFATGCHRLPTIPFLLERGSTSWLRKETMSPANQRPAGLVHGLVAERTLAALGARDRAETSRQTMRVDDFAPPPSTISRALHERLSAAGHDPPYARVGVALAWRPNAASRRTDDRHRLPRVVELAAADVCRFFQPTSLTV